MFPLTVLQTRRTCAGSGVAYPTDWLCHAQLLFVPLTRTASFSDILLTMHPLDPYRCANILIEQHGANAEIHAAMRADELDAEGNEAGRRAWMKILAALDDLRRTTPAAGERIQ